MSTQALLERAGLPVGRIQRLDGGDIATVERCGEWVVKTRAGADPRMFPAEAAGLRRLGRAGCRVPEVGYVDPDGLVLRYLAPGPADWDDLAAQLATLHGTPAEGYGLDEPVFIGPIPLPAREGDAVDVWRHARITPLLEAASRTLGPLRSRVERLLVDVEPPLEGPVWVHGDLWSGNVHMAAAGAALIDPSCWRGERAVDLSMMTLFGGFPPRFWSAYEARLPIPEPVREHLPYWRLYFLLVHVALFGEGYLSGVDRELSALRA